MNVPAEVPLDKQPLLRSVASAPPIALLGVPFDNVTTADTIALIEQMVASGQPHYLATANVDFLVQAMHDVELRRILIDAHLVLCDGTPLLWASRLLGNPLPERVAGSDLVPLLLKIAADKGYRVFFLGGSVQSTNTAIAKLREQFPTLAVAGHYSPPFADLLEMDHEEISRRIIEADPDMLFVSFGCPKQEKWISMHYRSLRVPVSVGVGGTIDFLAGTTKRAPKWMQRSGLEWVFRLVQEPRRLFKRYAKDMYWFSIGLANQWMEMRNRAKSNQTPAAVATQTEQSWQRIQLPARLDIESVRQNTLMCEQALATNRQCLLDLHHVTFIDSTGMGLLIRLQKKARVTGRQLLLVNPSQAVRSALKLMKLQDFFTIAQDWGHAGRLLENPNSKPVSVHPSYFRSKPGLYWRGEVTAANADEVWQSTIQYISSHGQPNCELNIDISSLQFIDSTGVGLMIRAKRNASQSGVKLNFVGTQPNVLNVLRMAKLETKLLGQAA